MSNAILVYYDIGAINGRSYPFDNGGNDLYIKKWIGIDPNFEEEFKVDGKNVYYKYAVLDREIEKISYYVSAREINNSLFVANKELFKGIHGRQCVLPKSIKEICCRRMENVIDENGEEIDILKIDAHGSEYYILNGLGKYLKDIIIIHVEIWNNNWYIGAVGGQETHNFLINNDFLPVSIINRDKKGNGWADIVYLNKKCCGEKYDLCKKIYRIKGNDIKNSLEQSMGWNI